MARGWKPPAIGSKARQDMPRHAFLKPSTRRYPFKTQRGGRWVASPIGLRQAYRAARFQGDKPIMSAARSKLKAMGRESLVGGKK